MYQQTHFSASQTRHRQWAAASVDEAEAQFRGYRLRVEIDPSTVADQVQQAALLTTVALARRVFLGGVTVIGPIDAPLILAMPFGHTLGDAVQALGATVGDIDGGNTDGS